MSLLGVHLTLLIGPTVAVPAPLPLTEALQSVEVTHSDSGRSGFQLTFQAGRGGAADLVDYSLLLNPLLKPFNRVVLVVTFGAIPEVLFDGIITNQQLAPGATPGATTLTVTGEDVSVMMDMKETTAEYPALPEPLIATLLILKYAQYGLLPTVMPPPALDVPLPIDRIPVQRSTDLAYLRSMAARYSFVFFITPGPLPLLNSAYWGPPKRLDIPQRALTVNMGADSNVSSINFQNNALAPTLVSGTVKDSQLNIDLPIETFISTRPPLVPLPSLLVNQPNVRTRLVEQTSGLTFAQAYARAQATTDQSVDNVVSASGELDALRYGGLLKPRGIVGLRGAGFSYDGLYYVKSVSHSIRKGEYKQRFSLSREGLGAITPVVRP